MHAVVLVAAGGLAREVLSSIRQAGDLHVAGLLDDDPARHGRTVSGAPVLGGLDTPLPDAWRLLVCAGSGAVRERLVGRLAGRGIGPERYATHVHPSCVVGENCRIGHGSILLAGCVLTDAVDVGAHAVVMPRVVLTHDDVVEDYATFAAGVALGGRVRIGRGAYLGMNSSVRQDLAVGEGAVLGMGSVLLRDLPAGRTWAGVPARDLHNEVLAGAVRPANRGEQQ